MLFRSQVPAGTNLELGCQGNTNMYRTQSGATFPYTLSGLISITGTNAGQPGYYYFFYDWEIQGPPCVSPRTPVQANTLASPAAHFTPSVAANVVDFTNTTVNGTTYNWDFGDGSSSTAVNPSHTYSATGTYLVCLTAVNGIGCQDVSCQYVTILTLGISTPVSSSGI